MNCGWCGGELLDVGEARVCSIARCGFKLPHLPPVVDAVCGECPWRREAAPSHLGPFDPETWIRIAHSDEAIACHQTITEDESWDRARQCAGAARYRANVAKRPRDPEVAVGPTDATVFGSPYEFLARHERSEV